MIHNGYWDYTEDNPSKLPYGAYESYEYAFEILKDCNIVEDWGSGYGYFKHKFGDRLNILNVDSAKGADADIAIDLYSRKPIGDGILLRHVLEHCPFTWKQIVANAIGVSKIVVICFLDPYKEVKAPDKIVSKSINAFDLTAQFRQAGYSIFTDEIDTTFTVGGEAFNKEWIFYAF